MFGAMTTPMDERYVKLMQNSPQYQMATQALAQGGDTSPVASPYAGIARALTGVAGGISAKKLGQKFYNDAQGQADLVKSAVANMTPEQKLATALVQTQPGSPSAPAPQSGQGLMPEAGPPPNPMMRQAGPRANSAALTSANGGRSATRIGSVPKYSYEQFKRAIIAQETGGRYGIANAEGSGARGIGQVMPETERALARKLGMPYQPHLMMQNTPEAKAYQDAITDAAVRDAWNYGGQGNDVATSARYYFAGPDRKGWGRKTAQYGRDILRRLGAGGADGTTTPETAAAPGMPAPQYDVPELPDEAPVAQRPEARAPAESGLLGFAKQMLATGDQRLMAPGMDMLDRGLQEEFLAKREAIAREYGLDVSQFEAAQRDHFDSRRDNRTARINERSNAIEANRQSDMAAYNNANRVAEREDQQQYGTAEREASQAFTASENEKQRRAAQEQFMLEYRGKLQSADEKLQAKRDGFWSTKTGSDLLKQGEDATLRTVNMDALLDEFEQLNKEQQTGSAFALAGDTGANVHAFIDKRIARMRQITEILAPTLREAGSGAMSDRDVEMYRRSIPNIGVNRTVNSQAIKALKRANERTRDFYLNRNLARADNDMQFTRKWGQYVNEVGMLDGDSYISYEDWQRIPSIPKRKR